MRTSLRLVLLAAIASLVWPLASFAGPQLYTISVQIDPVGAGTVTLDPAKSGYARNNVVTVSATPAQGMVFAGWGGALSGTQNPATLRVSGNHTVIAHFATDAGVVAVVAERTLLRPPAHCPRKEWWSGTSRNGRSTGAATCRSTLPPVARSSR